MGNQALWIVEFIWTSEPGVEHTAIFCQSSKAKDFGDRITARNHNTSGKLMVKVEGRENGKLGLKPGQYQILKRQKWPEGNLL